MKIERNRNKKVTFLYLINMTTTKLKPENVYF